LSISSVSHGFSTLCVEGIFADVCSEWREGKDDPRIFCRRKFQKAIHRSALGLGVSKPGEITFYGLTPEASGPSPQLLVEHNISAVGWERESCQVKENR
jgi:hypothetical protein